DATRGAGQVRSSPKKRASGPAHALAPSFSFSGSLLPRIWPLLAAAAPCPLPQPPAHARCRCRCPLPTLVVRQHDACRGRCDEARERQTDEPLVRPRELERAHHVRHAAHFLLVLGALLPAQLA